MISIVPLYGALLCDGNAAEDIDSDHYTSCRQNDEYERDVILAVLEAAGSSVKLERGGSALLTNHATETQRNQYDVTATTA